MSTFITGASGFIGRNLTAYLLSQGEHVKTISRKPTLSASDNGSAHQDTLSSCPGDVCDFESVEKAMRGCRNVYHLAGYARNWAKDLNIYYDTNVKGTENVLTAALDNGVDRVVVVSTAMVFGAGRAGQLTDETYLRHDFLTEYAHSEYLAECLVDKYVGMGLDVVIVNPTRVFGPGVLSEANSVTRMIQMCLDGRWRLLLGDGCAIGNYVYVEDVVRGIHQAMELGRRGERYILGGENLSFNAFFQIVSEIAGRSYRMFHVPDSIAMLIARLEKTRARYLKGYPLITPVCYCYRR